MTTAIRPQWLMSDLGQTMLMNLEGYREHVYKDAAGLPTIGVGHLLTKNELSSGTIRIGNEWVRYTNSQGLTREQVKALLAQDLRQTENAVLSCVTVTLTQGQFDALVSLVFNIGTGAFRQSTLLKVLNLGHVEDVPAQMRRWTRAGGKVLPGLVRRREIEINRWES